MLYHFPITCVNCASVLLVFKCLLAFVPQFFCPCPASSIERCVEQATPGERDSLCLSYLSKASKVVNSVKPMQAGIPASRIASRLDFR